MVKDLDWLYDEVKERSKSVNKYDVYHYQWFLEKILEAKHS